MDFVFPADHRVKIKEKKKRDKFLNLARDLKKQQQKTMEHKRENDIKCNWCAWNGLQRVGKGVVVVLEEFKIGGRA